MLNMKIQSRKLLKNF